MPLTMPLIFTSDTLIKERINAIQFSSTFRYKEGNFKNTEVKSV